MIKEINKTLFFLIISLVFIMIPAGCFGQTIGEAVDNTSLSWSIGGDSSSWIGQTTEYYYNGDAAQAKGSELAGREETYIETTVDGPGELSFYWKMDCTDGGFDILDFYIDGDQKDHIVGQTSWQQETYQISSGSHTLRWRYSKDAFMDAAQETGYVDKIEFTAGGDDPTSVGIHLSDGSQTKTVSTGQQFTFDVRSEDIDGIQDIRYIQWYDGNWGSWNKLRDCYDLSSCEDPESITKSATGTYYYYGGSYAMNADTGSYEWTDSDDDGNNPPDNYYNRIIVTVEEAATEPYYDVNITGDNSPVTEGNTLTVNADIENTGGTDGGWQDVALNVGGQERDSAWVDLNSGETTSETFSWNTSSGDAGSYTATVSSEDDSDSTGINVEEAAAGPYFDVNITGDNSPVTEGETLNVNASIENTGDSSDFQTITLEVDGQQRDSTSAWLSSGNSTIETFSWNTSSGDAGSYTATVSSEDDSDSTGINVESPINQAPNEPTNPSPSNGATGVSTSPTLSVDVSDDDGNTMDVTFYDGSGNSIDTDYNVSDGSTASVGWSGLNNDTTYTWYAIADDGSDTQSNTWSFTTGSGGGPSGGDVSGFAWVGADNCNPYGSNCVAPRTYPVGWVSFNSGNPGINCEGTVYGVSVDYDSGEISGSAFVGVGEDDDNQDCNIGEETVGWLYFDADNDFLVPSTPSFAGGEPAYVDGRRVKGWAPILSGDEQDNYREIVSWVRFDGTNHSVKVNGDGTIGTLNDSNHYAWAGGTGDNTGTVLGWIDLNPALGNANVDASSTVQLPEPNKPPEVNFDSSTADFDETVQQDNCFKNGTALVTLNWEYNDPEDDAQGGWAIRILHGGDVVLSGSSSDSFSAPPGDNSNRFPAFVTTDSTENLNYGTTYNWEVKVEDQGTTSGWIAASGYEFTTIAHPRPYPRFSINPPLPETGTLVTFEDESTCYNSPTGGGYSCSSDSINASYFWDFGDGVTSNVEGTATHTYSSVDDYDVELEITDNLGTCSETKSLQTILPLPEWEEIAP